jgi:hypothetical protein
MPATCIDFGDPCRNAATAKLQAIRRFVRAGQESLDLLREREKAALDAALPGAMKNIISGREQQDDQINIALHYSVHMEEFGGFLPRMLSYSHIIQIFSTFEEIGCSLCEEVARRIPTAGEFERPRNETLKAIKKYLKGRVGIKYAYWETLRAFNALRNCIVHRGGIDGHSDEQRRKFRAHTRCVEDLHIYKSGLVEPGRRHVEQFLSLVESLFETVFEQQNFPAVGFWLPRAEHDAALMLGGFQDGETPKVELIGTDDLPGWEDSQGNPQ